MNTFSRIKLASLALAVLIAPLSMAVPAAAQTYSDPVYSTWQTPWDTYHYDKRHVMLGTVAYFAPYRLTIFRRNGVEQTVDLKNGTVIYPVGATPSAGQRVALVGHYSNGVFVAGRVLLRR